MFNKPGRTSYAGFSAFELIGVLVVLSFILLSANKMISAMYQVREYNQVADQSKEFSVFAIKYIQDNYRSLVQDTSNYSEVILKQDQITKYQHKMFLTSNKYNQISCIYITSAGKSSVYAYLIFGGKIGSKTNTNISHADIAAIAKDIGNHAGTLSYDPTENRYVYSGSITKLSFVPAEFSRINTACGFSLPIVKNYLIMDLTKNSALFTSIQGDIDERASRYDPDPSLKKSELINMQANIYLDNVYKESSKEINHYCDVRELFANDADEVCKKYAIANGILMNENTAQWKSSISNGQSCIATPEANFYTMANKPSCDEIDMGSAANFCQTNLDGKDILSETAFWSTPEVNGNECVSTAYARYKTPGSCDGPNWWMDANNSVSRGDGDSSPNWQRAVSNRGDGMQRYIACAVKQADDHNSMVHCPGTYNKSTGMCDIKLRCIFAMFCKAPLVDASFLPTGGGQIDPIPSECGKKTLSAIQIPYPSLGDTKTCGSVERPLLTSTTEHLAQHVYRALDYSNGEVGGGRRIQIKSDAPAATTTYTSKLAVSNAGLQFGVISPISHTVAAGTLCKPTELGKILQDMSSSTIYSQIQCSYNPTFCSGAGYCYLPIKSTTFDYQFITAKTAYSCPPGTVVDNQQPSDNMVYVTCPAILGWQQIQGVHGEMDGCYTSVTKMRFCQSYLTACSYDQGKKLVPALKKLRCTNSTTEYIVDNYSQ